MSQLLEEKLKEVNVNMKEPISSRVPWLHGLKESENSK